MTAALAVPSTNSSMPRRRILVADGPEGGWTPHELEVLEGRSSRETTPDGEVLQPGARCHLINLGSRTLTTETACIALLAAVKEATGYWDM